jgi:hypothetical protein
MIGAIENVAEPRLRASTKRVRQHRERRRNGLRLMTVATPEANIEHAISRGLLKPEDRTKPWAVIQACYASWAVGHSNAVAYPERGDQWQGARGCSRHSPEH